MSPRTLTGLNAHERDAVVRQEFMSGAKKLVVTREREGTYSVTIHR